MAKVIHSDELEQHRKALPQPVCIKSAKAKPTESDQEGTNVLTGSAPPDLKYTPMHWPREWTDDALMRLLKLIPKNRHWIHNCKLRFEFRRHNPPEYFWRALALYPEHKTPDGFLYWIFFRLVEHLEHVGRLERRWIDAPGEPDSRYEVRLTAQNPGKLELVDADQSIKSKIPATVAGLPKIPKTAEGRINRVNALQKRIRAIGWKALEIANEIGAILKYEEDGPD
jgi:hypothetical protein